MNDKVDKVFDYIQDKILTGEWEMGDKITPEIPLAKELGVSRSVVREAMKKFVALNMLTRQQGGGTYVNSITPNVYFNDIIPNISLEKKGYLEILEVRKVLDPLAIALAVENNPSALYNELKYILGNMRENTENNAKFSEWDMKFHEKIAEYSANELVSKLYEIISSLVKVQSRKGKFIERDNLQRIDDHSKILSALKDQDVETSKIYAGRHIENMIKEVSDN